jgi:hypothetical protein
MFSGAARWLHSAGSGEPGHLSGLASCLWHRDRDASPDENRASGSSYTSSMRRHDDSWPRRAAASFRSVLVKPSVIFEYAACRDSRASSSLP